MGHSHLLLVFHVSCLVTVRSPREPGHHICSFVHIFLKYFQAAQGVLYLNDISSAFHSYEDDLQCSLWAPLWPLQTPVPLGEFSKDVAHSEFGFYITFSTSDSKLHKLFTNLLLFTFWKRIRLFWMPQSATAHETFCNARHSAFLMSEGCTWLEDFSFHFSQ